MSFKYKSSYIVETAERNATVLRVLEHLPGTLKKLNYMYYSDETLPRFLPIINFPQNLTHFNYTGQLPFGILPISITHLTLTQYRHNTLDHLPPNLTYLDIRLTDFSNSIQFPKTLKSLQLNSKFTGSVDDLPDSLIHLLLHTGSLPSTYIISKLPSNLKFLGIIGSELVQITDLGE